MADISKITPLGSQTTYNLKDATAREQANWNTNNGVKNLSPFNSGSNTTDYNYVTGEGGFSAVKVNIPAGEYIFIASANITGTGNNVQMRYNYSDGTYVDVYATSGSSIVKPLTFSKPVVSFGIYCNINPITFSNIAIIPKSLYNADSTYKPYSLPNTKITPELIELVDSGAKNKFKINPLEYQNSLNGLTLTWDENAGSVTVTGTMTDTTKNAVVYLQRNINGADLSGMILYGGLDNNNRVILQNQASPYNNIAVSTGTGVEIPANTATVMLHCFIPATSATVNLTFYPMICTKSAWDVSQKYVPYRPSYEETVEQVAENKNNILNNENNGYLKNYNLSTLVGGTATGAGEIEKRACSLAAGTYYISWVSTATSGSTVMTFYANGSQIKQEGFTNSTSRQEKAITLSQACDEIQIYTNTANTVSEVMISATANKPYIPYAPSNADIYKMILSLL